MNRRPISEIPYAPQIGCLALVAVLAMICLMPFILLDAMREALVKLHLSPATASLVIVCILIGGLINIPLTRIERDIEQPMPHDPFGRFRTWSPMHRTRTQSILAVNLGGCVIPVLLALHELSYVVSNGGATVTALTLIAAANIAVCFYIARPIPGLGIAMPAIVPPLVAVGATWLLLAGPQFREVRAPVAFIAGVAGPLVGADLLHLRRFTQLSAGVISIGGAGTFDGIVLSGLMAAFLA